LLPQSARRTCGKSHATYVEQHDLKEEFLDLIHEIHSRGWSPGTGGNFSHVLDRDPLRLLITASGVDKGRITKHQLLEVDRDNKVAKGDGKPSAEGLLHVPIIEERGANVVLNTHSVWNTLASLTGDTFEIEGFEMLKGLHGVTTHRDTGVIPILANSQDMVALSTDLRQILRLYPESQAVLLRGHGLYTWGEDIFEARRHLEVLEFLFELELRRRTLGGEHGDLAHPGS
jgi:methylthioribulose-1-phosphate dehydratase